MKKPKDWFGFSQVDCNLWDCGQSNMKSQGAQNYCHRKDRKGKSRPYWEGDKYFHLLKCHWNVCPKLKQK